MSSDLEEMAETEQPKRGRSAEDVGEKAGAPGQDGWQSPATSRANPPTSRPRGRGLIGSGMEPGGGKRPPQLRKYASTDTMRRDEGDDKPRRFQLSSLRNSLPTAASLKFSKEAAKEAKKMMKDRQNVVCKFAVIAYVNPSRHSLEQLHACVSVGQDHETVSPGTTEERPFWNYSYSFKTVNETVRFGVWNSATEEELGSIWLKYKDIKCDVVEEKALSLKGGPKGKLRIRAHVIPLATPFDPLFRLLEQKEAVLECVLDLANEVKAEKVGSSLVSLFYYRQPEKLPAFISMLTKFTYTDGAEHMTRVAKKAVSLYIALYRELFVDQCIFTVTKRAFENPDCGSNDTRVKKLVHRVLQSVKSSLSNLPEKVRTVFQELASVYKYETKEARYVVLDMLIVQTLCPALACPEQWGIYFDYTEDSHTPRALLTVSNILKAVVNQTQFPEGNQNAGFNEFIKRNQKTLDEIYELTLKTPPEFVACLKDPKQRALFHEFLKKNHSEENLEFWEAVQRYKAEDHNHERLAVGKRLAEKFLAEGAVSEVNVDSDDRKQISDSLERSEAPKELFDGAEKWVYQLMATGSFMKFRLSRPYKNFMESRSFVQRDLFMPYMCTITDAGETLHVFMSQYMKYLEPQLPPEIAVRKILEGIGELSEVSTPVTVGEGDGDSSIHRRSLELCQLLSENEHLLFRLYDLIAKLRKEDAASGLYLLMCSAQEWINSGKALVKHSVTVDLFTAPTTSVSVRLLGTYAQLIRRDYLDVLSPVIREIIEKKLFMEISADRVSDARELEDNYRNMRYYGTKILQTLLKSVDDMPVELREICRYIYAEADKASFPRDELREVMGHLVFHRLVCPAIVQPQKYLSSFQCEMPPESARSLILLSKLMVNIGSGVTFQDDHMMSSFNPFVRDSRDLTGKFYDAIIAPQKKGFAACISSTNMRSQFKEFLRSRASEENLMFYEAIEEYENVERAGRKAMAKTIYDTYVVPGAEYEVNLNATELQDLEKRVEEAPPDLFRDAKDWVYQMMSSGMYMQFSISPLGKRLLMERSHEVHHLSVEMVEKYADLLFTFLQRYKDELVESVFEGVDDEDEKKRLQGSIQKLKNIVGDAMTSSDDAPGLSEKDTLLIDVHAMLDSDDIVSKCLFDAVRDAEQSYVAYCVVYLYHTHGKAAELFKHALERDFDTDKIVITNLKENFVLQLAGKYLRLNRGGLVEELVVPHLIRAWESYVEAAVKKGDKKQKIFLSMVMSGARTIMHHLSESAFDVQRDIRNLMSVVLSVLEAKNFQMMLPRIASELLFRNCICDVIETEQEAISKRGNAVLKNLSKKDAKKFSEMFNLFVEGVVELLLAISSGNSISPSSALSALNEEVANQKQQTLAMYHALTAEQKSGLAGCLQSLKIRNAFRSYLFKSHSSENLDFWEDVEHYRTIGDPKEMKEQAMKLYIKYMAAGSEHAIVIDDQEKNNIKKQLLKPSRDLFDTAQRGVFEHMSTSSYLNFTVASQPNAGDAFPCGMEPAGMRECFLSSVIEHVEVLLFRARELGANEDCIGLLSSIRDQNEVNTGDYELPVPPNVVSDVLGKDSSLAHKLYEMLRADGSKPGAVALLKLMANAGCALDFLKWGIDFEMSAKGSKKWYKGPSLIKELMFQFVNIQRGTYLKDTVSHLSYEIVRQGIELEIAGGNSTLCKYAKSILSLLHDTCQDIPDEIRELCRHVAGVCPEPRLILGPLLFENFVCNGVFSPDLLQRLPDTAAKRSLVVLARLLCNIGSGKPFDENDVLFALNPYVAQCNSEVIELMRMVIKGEDGVQSLLSCLKSKRKRLPFRDFLKQPSRSKIQLLELWEEIQLFNSSIDEMERVKRAQGIYSKFLNAKDKDVGMDSKLKSEVKKELSNPTSLTFMPVMRFVLQALDKEYRAFLVSDSYVRDEFTPTPPCISKGNVRSAAVFVHQYMSTHLEGLRSERWDPILKKLLLVE